MTEPLDQSPEETPADDLKDDVVTQLTKAMDSRFSGFQGVLDKNISTLRNEFVAQLEEVKRSSLTPEEREDLEEAQRSTEIERLRKENQLLKLRKDYPDEVDFLSEWLGKENFDDQLRLLAEFRKANRTDGPTPTEEPVAVESAPNPVDLNNPKRPTSDSLADLVRNSGSLTREQAMKLLQATNEKGIMARLRREG